MENMIEPLATGIDRFANFLVKSVETRDTNPALINEILDDVVAEYGHVDDLTTRVFLDRLAEKNVAVVEGDPAKFKDNEFMLAIATSLLEEEAYELLNRVLALPADVVPAGIPIDLCAKLIQFCYVDVETRYDRGEDDAPLTAEEEAVYHYWFDVILPALQREMRTHRRA